MIVINVTFLTLFIVMTLWAVVVTWKWIKIGKIVLSIEERLDEAIDALDMYEKKIGNVLNVPLAGDDPFVRSVVSDIRSARYAIAKIVSALTNMFDEDENASDGEDKDERQLHG
jgi:hypothetical protein